MAVLIPLREQRLLSRVISLSMNFCIVKRWQAMYKHLCLQQSLHHDPVYFRSQPGTWKTATLDIEGTHETGLPEFACLYDGCTRG